jgi:hypothetical protein
VLAFLSALAAAVRAAGAALAAIAGYFRDGRLIELGERRADARGRAADDRLRDAVDRADPASVSDDEAFGTGGGDNDLPRAFEGRPAGGDDRR